MSDPGGGYPSRQNLQRIGKIMAMFAPTALQYTHEMEWTYSGYDLGSGADGSFPMDRAKSHQQKCEYYHYLFDRAVEIAEKNRIKDGKLNLQSHTVFDKDNIGFSSDCLGGETREDLQEAIYAVFQEMVMRVGRGEIQADALVLALFHAFKASELASAKLTFHQFSYNVLVRPALYSDRPEWKQKNDPYSKLYRSIVRSAWSTILNPHLFRFFLYMADLPQKVGALKAELARQSAQTESEASSTSTEVETEDKNTDNTDTSVQTADTKTAVDSEIKALEPAKDGLLDTVKFLLFAINVYTLILFGGFHLLLSIGYFDLDA